MVMCMVLLGSDVMGSNGCVSCVDSSEEYDGVSDYEWGNSVFFRVWRIVTVGHMGATRTLLQAWSCSVS